MNHKIYQEIVKHYKIQVAHIASTHKSRIFIENEDHLKIEKQLYKKQYHLASDEKITIEVDGFKCSFVDAIQLKRDFDQLIPAKQRFYYFAPEPKITVIAKPEVIAPVKIEPVKIPKRTYTRRFKVKPLHLPKLSAFQMIKIYLKLA